jgi:hypothetical protein
VTSICYCHGPTESNTSGPWPENDAYISGSDERAYQEQVLLAIRMRNGN